MISAVTLNAVTFIVGVRGARLHTIKRLRILLLWAFEQNLIPKLLLTARLGLGIQDGTKQNVMQYESMNLCMVNKLFKLKWHFFYNWIDQLSNTTIWCLDICCLLHGYQLHISVLIAIYRLRDWQQTCKQLRFGMHLVYGGGGVGVGWGYEFSCVLCREGDVGAWVLLCQPKFV